MSKSEVKVARRYAKALFESCAPANYESVSAALNELSLALNDSAVRNAIMNPSLSPQQRSSWVADLLGSQCPAEAGALANLSTVIVQNRRVDSCSALAEFFAQLLAHYKKLLALEVTSARELGSTDRESLAQKVKSGLSADIAAGVSFDWKTEAELLGGLQVRVGDKILDGSVSGAINKIARQLRG